MTSQVSPSWNTRGTEGYTPAVCPLIHVETITIAVCDEEGGSSGGGGSSSSLVVAKSTPRAVPADSFYIVPDPGETQHALHRGEPMLTRSAVGSL